MIWTRQKIGSAGDATMRNACDLSDCAVALVDASVSFRGLVRIDSNEIRVGYETPNAVNPSPIFIKNQRLSLNHRGGRTVASTQINES